MDDKEDIYDKEISPLMEKIIAICKAHEMPFFATFQYSDEGFCSSSQQKNGHDVFHHYNAIRQCIETPGFNIDKYLMWVEKTARKTGHSSIYLTMLGVETTPTTAPPE